MSVLFSNTRLQKVFLAFLLSHLSSYAVAAGAGGFSSLPQPAYAVATGSGVDADSGTRAITMATGSHAQVALATGNKEGIDPSKKILRCPFFVRGCPFTYTEAEHYYHHVHEKHRDKLKPFRCSYPCVANFDTPAELDAHITRRHKVALFASAGAVGAGSGVSAVAAAAVSASISPSALVARSFAVSGEGGGVDDSAQVASRKPTHPRDDTKQKLARNTKRRKHAASYEFCSQCPAYVRKDLLDVHNKKCHPQGTTYKYPCGLKYTDKHNVSKECAASSTTLAGLRRHQRVHANTKSVNTKNFKCHDPACPHKLYSRSAIDKHFTKCHTRSRPYKCPYGTSITRIQCTASFEDKKTADPHLKMHKRAEDILIISEDSAG